MKSFAWTLALRYLNPLRTYVSVITLISLMGVAFGVMVLVVVLSVHAGFERNLKEMLLGFSPHVQVSHRGGHHEMQNWRELEKKFSKSEEVEGAYALVEGYVIIDSKNWQQPVYFRAINTEDEAQVEALREMLDEESYPGSKAEISESDMVVDSPEKEDSLAVISKQLAEGLGLQVGDVVRVVAAKNLEGLMEVMRVSEQEAAYVKYADPIQTFEKKIAELIQPDGAREVGSVEEVDGAFRMIQNLLYGESDEEGGQPMRSGEWDLLKQVLDRLNEYEEENERYLFRAGTLSGIQGDLKQLEEIDLEKEDADALGHLDEFVLPLVLKIQGVYADSQRARGPGIFLPIEMGQKLKGLEDTVESLGIRTKDPYLAHLTTEKLAAELGNEWKVGNWMESHSEQFQLVKTERMMMTLALSLLMILSAFSIMAVMYTVTIQKRQEIGVMKALGARPSQVVRVFVYQGLIVGIFGALLGVGLGLLIIANRAGVLSLFRTFGFDPFPKGFHGMSELPVLMNYPLIWSVAGVAVVLCLIAALIPALLAAFRDPAKSLRNL